MEMNKLNVGTAAFPLAVIGIIAIMVVPMPSFVLDILLSVNIAAGVLVLLSTLNSRFQELHVLRRRDYLRRTREP